MQNQIRSFRAHSKNKIIATQRLDLVRSDWLQWLLFSNSISNHEQPQWSVEMLMSFSVINNPDANHFRSRLREKLNAKQFAEALLWYHALPSLARRVSTRLITQAFDSSGVDLASQWQSDRCGPLTENYIFAHCEPITLTDELPNDLKKWW